MAYELFTRDEMPENGWRTPKDDMAIFEYTITFKDDDTGEIKKDCIVGVSDDHAREEAWYECSSDIISVERGEFLYWQ